jgi:hypothetical protein
VLPNPEILVREPAGPERRELLDRVRAGAVARLPGALQAAGLVEPLHRAILGSLARTDVRAAAAIEARGFESLHEVLGPEATRQLVVDMRPDLDAMTVLTVQRLFAMVSAPRPLFIGARLSPRIHVPLDGFEVAGEWKELAEGHRVVGLGPHRDSWLGHPRMAVVLWTPLTRVRPENSLLIYPEAWENRRRPRSDEPIGQPIAFELDPGDVLAFSVEHLHGTQPNHTTASRVSVSARFTVDPLRYNRGHLWHPYVDPRLLDTPFARLAVMRSRCSLAYLTTRWQLARRRRRNTRTETS